MTEETLGPSEAVPFSCDILVVANVARISDTGLKIRREIECYHELGYSVGIRHIPDEKTQGAASPDIQHCIDTGIATIVVKDAPVEARIVLVFSPTRIDRRQAGFQNLVTRRVVLIVDDIPRPGQLGVWSVHERGIQEITLAPTNHWIRAELLKRNTPLKLEPEDWRSVAIPVEQVDRRELPDRRLQVGRFSATGQKQWPARAKLFDVYGVRDEAEMLYVGAPPKQYISAISKRKNWTEINFDSISCERFVALVDAFAYFPSERVPELPEAAIAAAMASGKPVFLPPRFQSHFGPGAMYCSSDTFKAEFRKLFEDPRALGEMRKEAQRLAQFQFSKEVLCNRIRDLVGPPARQTRKSPAQARSKQTVLFVPSNGVGLGHVTRLLAIARRMDSAVEPVFATLAQASTIIERSGYTAEYIPSQSDTGEAFQTWDRWFGFQLREIANRYQAQTIVFDGNHPSDGLVAAAGSRVGCKLVWVRRGMLGNRITPHIDNTRFIDLIIEPGEAARETQSSGLAARRSEVLEVPPVTLLDQAEALSRAAGKSELGLSPDRAAVLVQLGAGANRNVVGLTDKVVAELTKIDGLQLVVAEWENGLVSMPVWPGTKVLRGFPISRFFYAFDFSISAAGYNTYHEILRFGLPTVFLANRHPQMDDQWARAEFAQDHQAGFNLAEDELFQLPALCEALTQQAIRDVVGTNARNLVARNGAADAAAAISRLMGVS